MFKLGNIRRDQIAVVECYGEIEKIITAGKYFFIDINNRYSVKAFALNRPKVERETAEYLRNYKPKLVEQYCINFELSADEIGLHYDNDRLVEILPGNCRYLFWGKALNQRYEKVTLEHGYQFPTVLALELARMKLAGQKVTGMDLVLLSQVPAYYFGILKVDGEIKAILPQGVTAYWRLNNSVDVDLLHMSETEVKAQLVDQLRYQGSGLIEQSCTTVELDELEIGLRYENDVLVEILPPATRRWYWNGLIQQRVKRIKLTEDKVVPEPLLMMLLQPALRNQKIKGVDAVLLAQIPAYHVGVLKINGEVKQLLAPGVSGYWRFNQDVNVEMVDSRLQVLEVSGQEILTRDKVNLRVNLVASWRYADVLLAFSELVKPVEHLYRELQFGLREAIGTRTLDELLENKQIIDEVVSVHIVDKLMAYGVEVASLGVKDIVLPGDMKTILAQVVEAEKSAQANVIRRREETAATRSLLNTAKVMENSPVALRLKEMETLERIAERIDKISVFGGLDQVLNGLINIKNV